MLPPIARMLRRSDCRPRQLLLASCDFAGMLDCEMPVFWQFSTSHLALCFCLPSHLALSRSFFPTCHMCRLLYVSFAFVWRVVTSTNCSCVLNLSVLLRLTNISWVTCQVCIRSILTLNAALCTRVSMISSNRNRSSINCSMDIFDVKYVQIVAYGSSRLWCCANVSLWC